MTEFQSLKMQVESLIARLERQTENYEGPCAELTSGGVAVEAEAGVAELKEIKRTAEALKRDLERVRYRGQLDPEVRMLESRLEEALNRYYYLWHKCKDRITYQDH